MKTTRRTTLELTLGALALGAAGCGDDASDGGGAGGGGGSGGTTTGSGGEDISDVIYEGGATDEALLELLASAPVDDASQTASFTAPAAGTALDPAAPLAFAWGVGASARRGLPPGAPARSLGAPAPRHGASGPPSLLERVVGVSLGVRVAHAHGTPVNGRGYLLVFSTPSNARLLRVFTLLLEYTPDTAAWEAITGAGEAVTVTITNAIFEQNRVAPDGGPWVGAGLTIG